MNIWPFARKNTRIVSSKDLETLLINEIYQTAAGIEVNPVTAIKCTPVLAAITVIAQALAQLPLKVYERSGSGGRTEIKDHDLHHLFHSRPNDYQTGLDFKTTMQFTLGQWGNSYAKVTRIRDRVVELHPIYGGNCRTKRDAEYRITHEVYESGEWRTYSADEIWHLKDFSLNGWLGESRVMLARDAIATAIAAERYGGAFFKNGAKAKGFFSMPAGKRLKPEEFARLKEGLNEAAKDPHSTPLLEDGLDWKSVSQNAKDSQLIEIRQHQVIEIARVWNLPPQIIQSLERATWGNIETQGRQFVVYAMMPWFKNWEMSIEKYLLPARERGKVFVEFAVDAFLRGDSQGRAALYKELWQMGVMSGNDIAQKENLNPYDGGDSRYIPANMMRIDNAPPAT